MKIPTQPKLQSAPARVRAFASLLALAMCCDVTASEIVLYDPDLIVGTTQTLVEQGFQSLSSDFFDPQGFYSAGDNGTILDTTGDPRMIVSFNTHDVTSGERQHPKAPVLDSAQGFAIHFKVAIESMVGAGGEAGPDEIGFGTTFLADDVRGIAFFWSKTSIYALDDDSEDPSRLLAQAEGVEGLAGSGQLRDYTLRVYAKAYRLERDGSVILEGRRRDYRNFEGVEIFGFIVDPFDKPNMITFGETADDIGSRILISDISVETNDTPDLEMDPQISIVEEVPGVRLARVRWDSVPGRRYRIYTSTDLSDWQEFATVEAQLFASSAEIPVADEARRYVRIELLPDARPPQK